MPAPVAIEAPDVRDLALADRGPVAGRVDPVVVLHRRDHRPRPRAQVGRDREAGPGPHRRPPARVQLNVAGSFSALSIVKIRPVSSSATSSSSSSEIESTRPAKQGGRGSSRHGRRCRAGARRSCRRRWSRTRRGGCRWSSRSAAATSSGSAPGGGLRPVGGERAGRRRGVDVRGARRAGGERRAGLGR